MYWGNSECSEDLAHSVVRISVHDFIRNLIAWRSIAGGLAVGYLSVEMGMRRLVRMDVVWGNTSQVDVLVISLSLGVVMVKDSAGER